MAEHPGLFIVFEGGEGVGKTTQWARLSRRLEEAGYPVVSLREPGGTVAGDQLRSVLLDPASSLVPTTEALLFAASRAQLVETVIRPALERGAIIVVDRFLLSTYAYQGAGRGIALPVLQSINHAATGGMAPHLTLLLSMRLDQSLHRMRARGAADRMEREDVSFHARVRDLFEQAATMDWQVMHPEIGPVITIDACGSETEVSDRCVRALSSYCSDRFSTMLMNHVPTEARDG